MKQSSIEKLHEESSELMHKHLKGELSARELMTMHHNLYYEAKQMHKQEIFNALNQSAKEAYEAGQISMYCGCHGIGDSMTYEEWLYKNTYEKENIS